MFFSKKNEKLVENEFLKKSYSQTGEDLIVKFILEYQLGIKDIYYLDIGAYHPFYLSNTALFDESGYAGVCIEPNPILHENIQKQRPNCEVYNFGVGDEQDECKFFVISPNTLSTFSEVDARKYEKMNNVQIEREINLPVVSINNIMKKYCLKIPNFVSIDVEGLDLKIIQSLDFELYRPQVFCIETMEYTSDINPLKSIEIINYMESKEYFVYADTFINTIFVDKHIWNDRVVAL